MVTARLPGPVPLCLAARLDGPDHPPYLCQQPKGHDGYHRVSEPDLFVWEWPNTAAPSQATPDQRDVDHWQALIDAGNALADCLDRSPWMPDPDEDQAAVTAWRNLTATHSTQPNATPTPPPR